MNRQELEKYIVDTYGAKPLPNTSHSQQKSGKNPKNFTRNLVPLAGLEPARSLLRGILRQMCCEIHKIKNFSKSAKTGQFRTKNH